MYEVDFYKWIQETANQLKERQFDRVDWENLIEEIESMGRSEKRELASRLVVLLTHILKWIHQPSKRSQSWVSTIGEQQIQIENLLADSPSLNGYFVEILDGCYQKARKKAARETGLEISVFPFDNSFGENDILNFDFPGEPCQD
jgi:hypothetical protein